MSQPLTYCPIACQMYSEKTNLVKSGLTNILFEEVDAPDIATT